MERQESSKQNNIPNNNVLIDLQQTCQRHQGVRLDYLCIDSTQEYVFKCMFCVTDEDVKQYSLIPIQQVQSADQKTIFANYPLSDRELTKQLKLIVEQPSTGEALKSDIEKYFKDMRVNILSKLENIESKMVAKAQSISDFSGEIASLFYTMSEKKNIKNILINSEKSFDDKCQELKALSSRFMSKYEENQSTMRAAIHKISVLQKAIDFDLLNSIKNLILKQIDSINMLLIEDMAHFSEQLKESNHQNQNDIDQSINDIMKLVRNKFNSTSEDSCLKFEEQLNQIKFALSTVQVPQVGPIYEHIQSLTISQTQVISKLIEDITRSNSAVEVNEMKEPVQAEQMFELISNQANFCSIEYLEDIKNVIDNLRGVLGLFRTRKLNDRTDDQKAFNRIKISQLNNLAKLARKVNELTLDHADKYLQCQKPEKDVQQNSTFIRNQIQIDSQKDLQEQENNNDQINVDQLLVNYYPIFELLPFALKENTNKEVPIIFTKTNYYESEQMGITQVGSCVQLTCPAANICAQCVSQVLNKDVSYSIKLTFNRPYGQTKQYGFMIGLIQDSKMDSYLDMSGQNWFYSATNYSQNMMIVRGDSLSSESIRKTNQELQVRFCISKRQCFFSDSTYTNINQVQEEHIDPNVDNRFCFQFNGVAESDWMIKISDFKEIDPESVSKFQ